MTEDKSTNAGFATHDEEEPRTMTLMGGVVPEEESFEDHQPLKAGNKLLNNGTLVVALVAAVAAGSLYLMHVSLGGSFRESSTAIENQAKVETWLGKLTHPQKTAKDDPLRADNIRSLFASTDSIVRMFSTDFASEQVPIKYVKKNPFELSAAQGPSDASLARKLKRQQLEQVLAGLQLQSVMGGSQHVAVINGNLKSVGDTVGPFTVTAIEGLTVTLTADDETFTLSLATPGP